MDTQPATRSQPHPTGVGTDPLGREAVSEASGPGQRRWRVQRPRPVDTILAIGAVLALLAELILVHSSGVSQAIVPPVVGGMIVVAIGVPLAWRRVAPTATIALAGPAIGAYTLLGHEFGLVSLVLIIALYGVAAYSPRADARIALGICGLFVLAGYGTAWLRSGTPDVVGLVVTSVVLTGVWALGDRTRARQQVLAQLRTRAEEAERHQQLVAALATADERRRIARELHDVVAHAVSVVVVQASAGRRVADRDPAAAARVLADIEGSGREALTELRRLVDVLRDDHDEAGSSPQPDLADLAGLTERLAAAGLPLHLEVTGDMSRVPAGVAVSGYRIVQESLTNVLKHAGQVERVEVRVAVGDDAVRLAITDDGRGVVPPAAPPTSADAEVVHADPPAGGAGLVGLRERAAILGGSLSAGPHPRGGFEVRATLPLTAPGGR